MTAATGTTASRFNSDKLAAYLSWLASAVFTAMFFRQTGLAIYIAIPIAFVVQFLFTKAERPLWRLILRRPNGSGPILGILITILDAGFNAAGIYKYIPNIASTDFGQMLIVGFGLNPEIGLGSSILAAFVIGAVSAGLYEYLTERE